MVHLEDLVTLEFQFPHFNEVHSCRVRLAIRILWQVKFEKSREGRKKYKIVTNSFSQLCPQQVCNIQCCENQVVVQLLPLSWLVLLEVHLPSLGLSFISIRGDFELSLRIQLGQPLSRSLLNPLKLDTNNRCIFSEWEESI